MKVKATQTQQVDVELSAATIRIVTIDRLLQMLNLDGPHSAYEIIDGNLVGWYRCYEDGSWLGQPKTIFIRKADDFDKAVMLILDKLRNEIGSV